MKNNHRIKIQLKYEVSILVLVAITVFRGAASAAGNAESMFQFLFSWHMLFYHSASS
jgi:hypothetical protein